MKRNIEHFEERLEKENFSKEEVAKMLHNEARFTQDLVKKEYSSKIENYESEIDNVKKQLSPFLEKESEKKLVSTFDKLNGSKERLNDFKKLSGLTGAEAPEEIESKITEMKDSGNYSFIFKSENSKGPKPGEHIITKAAPKKGLITPSFGINLFKRKP